MTDHAVGLPSSSPSRFHLGNEGQDDVPFLWPLFPHQLLPSPSGTASTSVVELPPLPPSLPPPPILCGTAFVQYRRPDDGKHPMEARGRTGGSSGGNIMFRRMVELLRRMRSEGGRGRRAYAAHGRGFSHMMGERRRRQRLSKAYADLHSLLPPSSKRDKGSIVDTGISYLRTLNGRLKELKRKNEELSLRMAREEKGVKVRLQVAKPSSPVYSIIKALRGFKGVEAKARSMRWDFHGQELRADMDVESKSGASEGAATLESVFMQS